MKKTFYLVIALMLALTITGCSSSKDTKTEVKDNKTKIEEKEERKNTNKDKKDDNEKKSNKDDKKDNSMIVSTVDNILSCEMKNDSYNGTIDIIWVDGLLNELDFKINVAIDNQNITDDLFDTTVELTKQMIISQYGIDENAEGISLKTESNKETKTITFNFYIDLTKASKENLSKFSLNFSNDDLKANIDDVKTEIEKAGFTCQKKYN